MSTVSPEIQDLVGEPAIKMLRYQQQFRFFDPTQLNTSIRFVNLGGAACACSSRGC